MRNLRQIFVLAALTAMPFMAMAQGEWEVPGQGRTDEVKRERRPLFDISKKVTEAKYLEGAVPVIDGKVVFTLDEDVANKSAQEIYDIVYATLERLTKGENQFEESHIALVNKKEHVIAAKFREWLVFKSTALALDRTVFGYTIIANCTDGHLNLTLSRINYAYELDRGDSEGLITSAEEWITDENALNKAKTKLRRHSGKFRRKTIDRKDEIFQTIIDSLKK